MLATPPPPIAKTPLMFWAENPESREMEQNPPPFLQYTISVSSLLGALVDLATRSISILKVLAPQPRNKFSLHFLGFTQVAPQPRFTPSRASARKKFLGVFLEGGGLLWPKMEQTPPPYFSSQDPGISSAKGGGFARV